MNSLCFTTLLNSKAVSVLETPYVSPVFLSFHLPAAEGFEPPRDKTNKMACAFSEDLDQPGHPPSLIRVCCLHEESLGP